MRITVLLKKDGEDMKGEFIAAHNRLKNLLLKSAPMDVTSYIIKEYNGVLLRLIKRQKIRFYNEIEFESLKYKVVWIKKSIIDVILSKFNLPKVFQKKRIVKACKHIQVGDLIIAHSLHAGLVALEFKRKFKTKFMVTWHGSDIHTNPWLNHQLFYSTKEVIENASYNCFVSNNLLNLSNRITPEGVKIVLYNGVDDTKFYPYTSEVIYKLKQKWNISKEKNIAFIGNLFDVKNVLVLPEIFKIVKSECPDVKFNIIGDGYLKERLKIAMSKYQLNVKFWGNISPLDMPEVINIMDLIVLPSKNEGLPLIALEALACGVPLVGSDVGGVSEVVGKENVVPLGQNFIENFSRLVISYMNKSTVPILDPCFYLSSTSHTEFNIIDKLIHEK